MKVRSFLITVSITLLAGSALAEIDLLSRNIDWQPANQATSLDRTSTGLHLISSTNPGIYTKKPLQLLPADSGLIIIEMDSSTAAIAELSWANSGQGFSAARSYPFYIRKGTGKYYINLKAYAGMQPIQGLLFYAASTPAEIELKGFAAVRAGLPGLMLAAWQEFWGPQGRQETGHDFLLLPPVRLCNRPVLAYLNWLLLLICLLSLLLKRPKLAISSILVIWILLAAAIESRDWNRLANDLNYLGLPIETKRSMQNYEDFYAFICFAKERLPENSSFLLIFPPKFRFTTERASYYLYPRKWQANHPEYLLLFNKMPNDQTKKHYDLAAEFRPGAYIFKRKIK
ncbi:MAG: hypothetical protein JW782_07670 [Candidatus Saganbacteria bacterium]|nr:hypothetical protein [Candidatus Saganbacteria bacterium]